MGIEDIFCPKCHKLAAEVIRNEGRVELRQNGKVLLALSAQSRCNKIGVQCPSGHNVEVEL